MAGIDLPRHGKWYPAGDYILRDDGRRYHRQQHCGRTSLWYSRSRADADIFDFQERLSGGGGDYRIDCNRDAGNEYSG